MDDPKPLEGGARTGTLSRADLLKGAAAASVGAGAMGALLADRASAHSSKAMSKGNARERGLYCHLTRILWITVNVSDLERSIDFYERTYPVTRAERTNGPAQSFRSLGIKHGEFEGRVMRDSQPFQGRALHLVQWKSPGPVGEPYKEANHVGFYRHHASATQSGLNDRYANVLAQGGRPYGPPSFIFITPTSGTNAFAFLDPDGTTLEWVGALEPNPAGLPDNLSAYNANCRDLRRSYRFYRDVMGQAITSRLNPIVPQPASSGSLGNLLRNPDGSVYTGLIDFDAAITGYRADFRNVHDLLEWQMPRPFGEPYEAPNNLGSVNVAWEVDDIDASYEKLVRLGIRGIKPGLLRPPEEWDMGEYGTRKVLNFRDPDGIMIQLHERPPSTAEEPI
jgi:catechol 2,3-dioxygenase-like lactoylglutathione lyase family enzyme